MLNNFKLKSKPKKQGIKLEQLHKEGEIFILKSKRRIFSQEDLTRFLKDFELRKELEEIETTKTINNTSFQTQGTVEYKLREKLVQIVV